MFLFAKLSVKTNIWPSANWNSCHLLGKVFSLQLTIIF